MMARSGFYVTVVEGGFIVNAPTMIRVLILNSDALSAKKMSS